MRKIMEMLAVTYAAVGQEVSDAAMEIMAKDLADYPEDGIAQALTRCRRELRKMSLADILDRLPNGHLGPEEAWAIMAPALSDERVTVVRTEQMGEAFGVALGLADDPIAARMAFLETYKRAVSKARAEGEFPKWLPSLGWDVAGREGPLREAVRLGRLPLGQVDGLLPDRSGSRGINVVVKAMP
jgi:hypothetical protein